MNMKKIWTLLFVSILGGTLTLATYKLLLEEEPKVVVQESESKPLSIPVNYTNTALKVGPQCIGTNLAGQIHLQGRIDRHYPVILCDAKRIVDEF